MRSSCNYVSLRTVKFPNNDIMSVFLFFSYLANYVIPDIDLLVNDELIVLQQAKPFWIALFHLNKNKLKHVF